MIVGFDLSFFLLVDHDSPPPQSQELGKRSTSKTEIVPSDNLPRH